MSQYFTQGDWFLNDDLTIRSKAFGTSDQMADYQGNIIADLKPALGATDGEDLSIVRQHARAEMNANGALIVAAPKMFEELHRVADWMHDEAQNMQCTAGNPDGGSSWTCEHCQHIEWMNRIDALLTKAGAA